MAMLCVAQAFAQSSFETALALQEGSNVTPALNLGYDRGAYFWFTATETTVISLTPGDGGSVAFYFDGEKSYDYSTSYDKDYVGTYSIKVSAGQTVHVLATQGNSSSSTDVMFTAVISTGVLQHGMEENDPIALEMGKTYWFEGGNAYFTYTATDDGMVIFTQPSYCYDASYKVDGTTKMLSWSSDTKQMSMPVKKGKTYKVWTSASSYSMFCVSAQFTQPKQGEVIENPFILELGNNTVPAAAGKYYYKFLNEDDLGFLEVKATGVVFSARTTGTNYDNLASNQSGVMRLQVDMDQEVVITVEKAEATAEAQIMTATFELPQKGDVEGNPIVLTSSETIAVSSPVGVKFYSIKNTGASDMFLNVHVDTKGISSYGSTQVKVYKKGDGYQWGGSKLSSDEDYRIIVAPGDVYMVYVKNVEEGAVEFRVWLSEIAKGDVFSNPIEAVKGENTVTVAGQKFYAYTAQSTCRLNVAVGNSSTTTLFFPAYDGDDWMGVSLISSDGGVYVLAAEKGTKYVFRMTGAAVGDKFVVSEEPYKAGQSRSNPIVFDGNYEFDDMNPYDVWLAYDVKTSGIAEITPNGFGDLTYDDNIYFMVNDESEYANNMRGYDSDYNEAMLNKSLAVKAGDRVYFHIAVKSYQEGASFAISVREPAPGEASDNPIVFDVNKPNTIEAVGYLDNSRWYSFDVAEACEVTFSATGSVTLALYDADMTQVSCGEYTPDMHIGGYYGDCVKELAAGKYYAEVTYADECELTISGSGVTTAISAVNAGVKNSSVIYNLAGQRVKANAKGLYIVNGKKVLMK